MSEFLFYLLPSEGKVEFLPKPMKSGVITIALFAKFRPCNLNEEKNMPSRCNRRFLFYMNL